MKLHKYFIIKQLKYKYKFKYIFIFRYQSTFWMEPRIIPVKYTTEVNFNPESTIKRFSEKIDLQVTKNNTPFKYILIMIIKI